MVDPRDSLLSDLPEVTTPSGTDEMYLDDGLDKRISVANLLLAIEPVTKKIKLGNANLGKGASAPTQVIEGNYTAWDFTINDDAVLDMAMPPYWEVGSDMVVKVCWYVDDAFSGADEEVRWECKWSAIPMDFTEAVDAPGDSGTLDSGDIDIAAVAKYLGTSTIGTIDGADLAANDMLGFVLKRIALATAGANPANNPRVHHLIIEYTADKLGEAI